MWSVLIFSLVWSSIVTSGAGHAKYVAFGANNVVQAGEWILQGATRPGCTACRIGMCVEQEVVEAQICSEPWLEGVSPKMTGESRVLEGFQEGRIGGCVDGFLGGKFSSPAWFSSYLEHHIQENKISVNKYSCIIQLTLTDLNFPTATAGFCLTPPPVESLSIRLKFASKVGSREGLCIE